MDQPTQRLDAPAPDPPAPAATERLAASAAPAARAGLCPECGGPMTEVRIRYGTAPVYVEMPDASGWELLRHQAWQAAGRSPLTAWVCTDCGFTKLYAKNLAQLLER